jgi:uncharacterized phiE125 gp8 family phage protein
MRTVLITAATFKPLEVEAIKLRPELRIASSTDDLVIADMLQSAIEAYEEFTNNILCRQELDLYLDRFPRHREEIETPAPLASVTSITYLDSAGDSQVLASSTYKVDGKSPIVGRIALSDGESWPHTPHEIDTVTIRLASGFADANSIPRRVKDGLLLKIQEIYYGTDLSEACESCWRKWRRIPI